MPRSKRCVLPGTPCHITQRGVDRRETFSSDPDRQTYLGLLQQNLPDSGVRILGWCLMTNHVHLIAVPASEDSLSVLLRRVHFMASMFERRAKAASRRRAARNGVAATFGGRGVARVSRKSR